MIDRSDDARADEAALLTRIAARDERAVEELYARYGSPLSGVPQLNAPEGIRTVSPEHETSRRMGLRSRCA